MKKVSKAIGGGAGGGIGATIAPFLTAFFPEMSVELVTATTALISAIGGFAVAYLAPANK